MSHTCHVNQCTARVPPTMLMCLSHWRMVPQHLQADVQHSYQPGQCSSGRPSALWLKAARAALNHVAKATGVFHG